MQSKTCLNNYSNLTEYSFCSDFFLHSVNVANIATKIGADLGMPLAERRLLYELALYHDIGKSKIPEFILYKEEELTCEEWQIMKKHAIYSQEIYLNIKKQNNENIKNALILRHHHENWDGSGYPDGISGKNIPFFSRIIKIADVFDAITQPRVYRTFKIKNTMEIMEKMLGRELDPYIFEKSFNTLNKLLNYRIEEDTGNWEIEKVS